MEDISQDSVCAFNARYTTQSLCILKVLLPYLPVSNRHGLAVYIKWMELMYTLTMSNPPYPENPPGDIVQLYDEIMPFLNKEGQEQLKQMRSVMETVQSIQMLKEILPEGAFSSENMDISSLFENLQGESVFNQLFQNM